MPHLAHATRVRARDGDPGAYGGKWCFAVHCGGYGGACGGGPGQGLFSLSWGSISQSTRRLLVRWWWWVPMYCICMCVWHVHWWHWGGAEVGRLMQVTLVEVREMGSMDDSQRMDLGPPRAACAPLDRRPAGCRAATYGWANARCCHVGGWLGFFLWWRAAQAGVRGEGGPRTWEI